MSGDRIFALVLLAFALWPAEPNTFGQSVLSVFLAWQANDFWNRNGNWFTEGVEGRGKG
jgi:hypothetical protein